MGPAHSRVGDAWTTRRRNPAHSRPRPPIARPALRPFRPPDRRCSRPSSASPSFRSATRRCGRASRSMRACPRGARSWPRSARRRRPRRCARARAWRRPKSPSAATRPRSPTARRRSQAREAAAPDQDQRGLQGAAARDRPARAAISDAETKMLEAMEGIETARAGLCARAPPRRARERAAQAGGARSPSASRSWIRRSAICARDRAGLAGGVGAQLLQRYDRIATRRRPAVALGDKGMCQGCRVGLPPQLCSSCGAAWSCTPAATASASSCSPGAPVTSARLLG